MKGNNLLKAVNRWFVMIIDKLLPDYVLCVVVLVIAMGSILIALWLVLGRIYGMY